MTLPPRGQGPAACRRDHSLGSEDTGPVLVHSVTTAACHAADAGTSVQAALCVALRGGLGLEDAASRELLMTPQPGRDSNKFKGHPQE